MSAHQRPSPRHLPCYLATDANAVTQARRASIQAREADDEPSAHPPCHRDSHARRATATNSQKPPRAPDALKSMGSSACRPVRDTHNGTAPLPGSLSPLPRRRLPHLVLKAGRAAREEHRGRLRATDRAQDRCTWSPCRPPCRHSSNGKCHCRLGVCHRCSGKAPTCLVTQAHEQRSRAMLPLTMTLPNAAQRQPRRSFMTMRTDDEQMRTQTADERTVSLMQCPCHAWSHSHGRRARTTKHKQHDLDLAFHPEPCRWCLYSI